jgi:hypothetical protein
LLKELYGKRFTIIIEDNKIFHGVVDDYIFPEDNDDNKESIILATSKSEFIEFKESKIANIIISQL